MTDDPPPRFDLSALPPVIGHRGAARHAPENTLAGIRTAARLGARWVEVDVKLTADGVAVLMHDDTLDRTTDGSGPVVEHGYDRIRDLDAGRWFGADFAGEPVPTLTDTLGLCAALGLGINIEVKPNPGQAVQTVSAIADTVSRHASDRGAVLISSFARDSVTAAREHLPTVPRAFLVDREMTDVFRVLEECGAVALNPHHRLVTGPTWVAAFVEAGVGLIPYTVNDGLRIQTLLAWGVRSVVTDDPLLAPSATCVH